MIKQGWLFDIPEPADLSLARAPGLETAGSFLGMPVVIDPALPPNVIEFRDAEGRLLAREFIGPVS